MEVFRGTITRRLDSVLSELESEFSSLYCAEDFESALNALKKAGNRSDRPSKLKNIFVMLDNCGINYEKGKDNEYYERLIRKYEPELSTFSEVEDKMLLALYTRYQDYPSPETYMQRLVDRLCDPEDHWEGDTLRLRILKQFIRYGNYLVDADFGGRMAIRGYVREKLGRKVCDEDVPAALDDQIFSLLETATKQQKKPEGKYGLIKAADDLAFGKFHTGGVTKKYLYLFAMVYGMTYDCGEKKFNTDVETQLFRDYYTNNLIRFISDVYKDAKLCEYEMDPSGQGINYKNFAEMIYLYYISKDDSPQEKIRRSNQMIKEVREAQFHQEELPEVKAWGTKVYRDCWGKGDDGELFAEDILSMDEAEFREFICANYHCDTYRGSHPGRDGRAVFDSFGELELKTEQHTAYQVYEELTGELIRELAKLNGHEKGRDYSFQDLSEEEKEEEREAWLRSCNYGLWFTDVHAMRISEYHKKQDLYDRLYRMLPAEKKASLSAEALDDFIALLLAVNNFAGYGSGSATRKTKALYVSSDRAVSRTSMIVAYYYYYNARKENENLSAGMEEAGRWKCFQEVFDDFAYGVNHYLERAYYQPLNGKNIFDVMIVFSSYAYMHGLMF